jgi:hypothetical protein
MPIDAGGLWLYVATLLKHFQARARCVLGQLDCSTPRDCKGAGITWNNLAGSSPHDAARMQTDELQ